MSYTKITENFSVNEMKCPCCGECEMDDEFMFYLQEARSCLDFQFPVNSAYRCEDYNATNSPNSKGDHVLGCAVDIRLANRYKRANLLKYILNEPYFKDIAIDKTFIHIGRGKVKKGVGVY